MSEQIERLVKELDEHSKKLKQIEEHKTLSDRLEEINKKLSGNFVDINIEELQSLIPEKKEIETKLQENKDIIVNEETIKNAIEETKEKMQNLKKEVEAEIKKINEEIATTTNNGNDELINKIKEYSDILGKAYEEFLNSNEIKEEYREIIKDHIANIKSTSKFTNDINESEKNKKEELIETKKEYETLLEAIDKAMSQIKTKETILKEQKGTDESNKKTEGPILENNEIVLEKEKQANEQRERFYDIDPSPIEKPEEIELSRGRQIIEPDVPSNNFITADYLTSLVEKEVKKEDKPENPEKQSTINPMDNHAENKEVNSQDDDILSMFGIPSENIEAISPESVQNELEEIKKSEKQPEQDKESKESKVPYTEDDFLSQFIVPAHEEHSSYNEEEAYNPKKTQVEEPKKIDEKNEYFASSEHSIDIPIFENEPKENNRPISFDKPIPLGRSKSMPKLVRTDNNESKNPTSLYNPTTAYKPSEPKENTKETQEQPQEQTDALDQMMMSVMQSMLSGNQQQSRGILGKRKRQVNPSEHLRQMSETLGELNENEIKRSK